MTIKVNTDPSEKDIQAFLNSIRGDKTHREQMKDRFSVRYNMPSNNIGPFEEAQDILNEFDIKDGIVQISLNEFLDLVSYVADEYYG